MGKNNGSFIAAKALLFIFFALFFLYPLSLILAKALNQQALDSFFAFLFSKPNVILVSFLQAALSTFFSVLVGIPAGFLLAGRNFPGKKIFKALSLVPFIFPSILVVISFVIIFGNNGWINYFLRTFLGFPKHVQFLYGLPGIILAHVFYNFPIAMRFVSTSLENTGKSMQEAAKTLGADNLQVFLRITLPEIMPSILSAASIIFIYTFMSFAIVISLGGIQFATLEVEIYRQISRNLDFGLAALLSVFQFLLLLLVTFAYLHFSKKNLVKGKFLPARVQKISLTSFKGLIECILLLAVFAFIALPIFSIIVFSFFGQAGGNFSLKAYEKVFLSQNESIAGTTPLISVFFSIAFAVFASLAATFMGLIAGLQKSRVYSVEILLNSALAVSVVMLGFGYLLSFGSGNFFVIAIGHAVIAFPFAFRIIGNALERIESESLEAAKTLGAGEFEVLRFIQIPRIKNAIFAALAFCFAVSFSELGLVLILYDGIYPTMPVYIYRLLATFDLFAASAMGVVLITVSFLAFYAIEHFSKKLPVI